MGKDSYHLDYETFSEADLKKFGAYRYACDPSTEILIFSIARNDERPLVWDVLDSFGENTAAISLLAYAVRQNEKIYAHNAQFEAAISKYLFEKTFDMYAPLLTQWRCTAAMCRRAAIPSSLEGMGEFLGLNFRKDKEGKRLINKFSVPRKPTKADKRTRILPQDGPEDFRRFGEYCRQDVEVERDGHKVLTAFELEGAVLESFQFDLRMNDMGIPVNVESLKLADKMINEYTERLAAEFRAITGVNHTQYDECLDYFRANGYPFSDLQAPNVEVILENGASGWEMRYLEREREVEMFRLCYAEGCPADSKTKRKRWIKDNKDKIHPRFTKLVLQPVHMGKEAFKALTIRSLISFAAVKKIPTMLGMVCPDGRCRGAMLWSGAERTHRWAGRIIQPQNFRRPRFKGTEQAFKMLCDGVGIETLELLFAPFLEIVASSIRHFIQWPGGDLLQADYSSVEARGNPWLCGAEDTLQLFRDGALVYELMAAKIFGVPLEEVTGDQRFVGKQAILGCGYNMGRPKFRGTCESYNFTPPAAMVEGFKPRFKNQLAKMAARCESGQPFEEREIKFPRFKWARLKNGKKGPEFSVYAYRKGGTCRKIKDLANITAEEWLDLTYDDLADRAVTTWREDNPKIVQAWKDIDNAAKNAIKNPGKPFKGTDKIIFGVTEKPGFRALVMRLPSGHSLIYPKPKLVWKGEGEPNWDDHYNTEIHFWGKLQGKSGGTAWGWCKTYGGKLLENATQAICGDFMANGACNASKHGYDIFMLVHDEAIGPQKEGQTQERLCELLCDLPKWAEGMPLAADGNVIEFYKKT